MAIAKIPENLKARTAAEWVAGIKALRGHGMRARVASIVWWDFSEKFGPEDRNPLEHWMAGAYDEAALELPDELIMEGLRKLGYTEEMLLKKFDKRTQPLGDGRTGSKKPVEFNRRDCTIKRAKKWNQKERNLRCI